MRRAPWRAAIVAAALVLAACDSGPKGPGTLSVVVSGANLGGVVLQVSGKGIRGFQAAGSAKVYSAQGGSVPGSPNELVYRVIVLGPQPGTLQFGIRTRDVAGPKPSIAVIDAVDGANNPVPGGGIHVSVSR